MQYSILSIIILVVAGLVALPIGTQENVISDEKEQPSQTQASESQNSETGKTETAEVVVSDEHAAEIHKLLELTRDVNQRFVLLQNSLIAFKKRVPGVKQEFWDECDKLLNRDDLVGELTKVYAKHYSRDDIKQLVSFFQSPVGKKFLEKSPFVQNEANRQTNLMGRKLGEMIGKKLDDEGYAR